MTSQAYQNSTQVNIPLNPEGIPRELQALPQWVGWRFETKPDGKPTKVPVSVRTGAKASTTDPETWASFTRALESYSRDQVNGIGFVFTRDDPYVGIDVDANGLDRFDALLNDGFATTYAEVSPSGKGLHLIGKAKLPIEASGKRPPGLEIYQHSRFFTMTGNLLDGEARPIRDVQDVIDRHWNAWFPPRPESAPPSSSSTSLNDEKILEQARSAKNGAKFDRLWSGDTSGHGDDDSVADLALCSMISFYTQDTNQIDRLFRRSGLYRDKWERKDYRADTIAKALDRSEFYEDDPKINLHVVWGGKTQLPRKLPAIDAGNQRLEVVSAQAWQALQRANTPPRMFRFGGVPVRIEGDDDAAPVPQPLTEDRLGHELARCAAWFKTTQKGDAKPASPPPRVIKDMIAAPVYPLPSLLSIVQTPVFAPDGSLQTEPGYHEAGKTFYAPAPGFVVPTVPSSPTAEDVKRAKALILDDMLGEFSFIGEAERANAVALFLDLYVRNLIDGPTPLRLIEAPTPGSGKGLLADVILRAAIGSRVTLMTAPSGDDEWRKRITAQLSQLPAAILIDNVTTALDSGSLAGALTATWWSDRRLGVNEMIRVPVRCVWLATANNPTFSTELARRTVRIRLDPKVDRPWQRTGFRHEDLRGWADEHRPEIVCAALTLVQSWVSAGQPLGTARLGSFEQWAAVHSGILDHLGIKGFLGNLESFYETADVEGAIWRQFVALWFEKFNESEVGVADLFDVAQGVEGFDFGQGSERAQKTSFGMALGRQRDRVIGDCRVTQAGTVRRAKQWQLVKGRPDGNPPDADHAPEPGEAGFDRRTA